MSGILTQTPTQHGSHGAASTSRSANQSTPHSRQGGGGQGSGHRSPPGGHVDRVHTPHAPRWTTPNKLRTAGGIVAAIAIVVAIVVGVQASSIHSRVDTLDHVDAPGVAATSDFSYELQDMDAQLANALLINGDATLSVSQAKTLRILKSDEDAADADLQTAATSSVGDAATQAALTNVSTLFDSYKDKASRALQLDENPAVPKAGHASTAAVTAYVAAYSAMTVKPEGMSASLVDAAKNLYAADSNAIGTSTSTAQNSIDAGVAIVVIGAVVLILALVLVQLRMIRMFRRTLNPALAAATAAALLFLSVGAVAFTSTGDDLSVAKSQAFDSVQALTQAKATSYDANADESRWLLVMSEVTQLPPASAEASRSTDEATKFGLDFQTKSELVAAVDPATVSALVPDYAGNLGLAEQDPAADLTEQSSFGAEFRNITFPDEAETASTAFTDFVAYEKDDAKLRTFDEATASGLHDAIDFDTNASTAGTSDADFNKYSSDLQSVIAINQSHFGSSMASALNGSTAWSWLPYVFVLAIIGLIAAGLRPRLVEYRF